MYPASEKLVFQSSHSGIETREPPHQIIWPYASNHPIVELKHICSRSSQISLNTSNHPIVELKLPSGSSTLSIPFASNHPIVELKLIIKCIYGMQVECFQSSHSGIETQPTVLTVDHTGHFQSSHSGIETTTFSLCNWKSVSSNHPIVELKLRTLSLTKSNLSSFQSSHSGIETVDQFKFVIDSLKLPIIP